jgi:hypothetical protein
LEKKDPEVINRFEKSGDKSFRVDRAGIGAGATG